MEPDSAAEIEAKIPDAPPPMIAILFRVDVDKASVVYRAVSRHRLDDDVDIVVKDTARRTRANLQGLPLREATSVDIDLVMIV
mmetsp:Transcript_19223/g.35904  ORF Transcript_19223/g.35904 Transcript_19223/m.35904 type:complete len:83 (-) Transcript_19223:33-281(-)